MNTPEHMDAMLEVARNAALEAGRHQLERLGQSNNIRFKGSIDLVTDVDKRSEEIVVGAISAAFPDHGLLGEEGTKKNPDSDYLWIIDPLDGTTNYAHTYPCFAVSIGCSYKKELVLGAVYDASRDEMFTAARGRGAFLNGRPIRVSETEELSRSLLATGFPYNPNGPYGDNIENLRAFLRATQGVRRAGAAALDLCHVACGRIDGYWEINLFPWDAAAAAVIVLEAGGTLSKSDASVFCPFVPEMVASNTKIHAQMLEVLQKSMLKKI